MNVTMRPHDALTRWRCFARLISLMCRSRIMWRHYWTEKKFSVVNPEYLHIAYIPQVGWILSIMSRLLNSPDSQLRNAFQQWSGTPLKDLGFAITTRMHMLGLGIRRLNKRVQDFRNDLSADPTTLDLCLKRASAFQTHDRDLPYELLLDMDSFIFETRSLYEIMGKFLKALFQILFSRKIEEADLVSVLSNRQIDTRWILELREHRKLFFHDTAPWIAARIERQPMKLDPVLLRTPMTNFDPNDLIEFEALRDIYNGFVSSTTELHHFIMQEITRYESKSTP